MRVLWLLAALWMLSITDALGPLPLGRWYAPQLNFNVKLEDGVVVLVNSAVMNVSANGIGFSYEGEFNYQGLSRNRILLRFDGSVVCSTRDDALIVSVDLSTCVQQGDINAPRLCGYALRLYAGEFSYGVAGTDSSSVVMQIDRWSGSQFPIIFQCVDGVACATSVSCNKTSINTLQLFVDNSNIAINGTQPVIFQAGSSTNNTVVIQGETVTLQDSTVTLQQSNSSTSTTVNLGGTEVTNEITFVTQDSTLYNFYTTAPASCRNYASVTASRSTNLTLSTLALTRVTFTASSIEAPGSDWSLSPDSSTLRYLGGSGEYGYALQGCLQLGSLYGPLSTGVAVALQLYNQTVGASSPLLGLPVQSMVFYNHTNPALLTSVCAGVLLSGLYTDNLFSLYATLEVSSGTYATAVGPSSWSLTVTPLACKGEEISIKINATFNDTQLEAGTCITTTYPDAKTVRINNPGVCTIEVPEPAIDTHSNEGMLRHMWHRVKNAFVGGYAALSGTIRLMDTTNIKVLNTNANNVEFQFRCPIDCGSEPIKTNSTCDCKDGVQTEGSCTCGQSVSTPGSCTCEQGVETPSVETPNGDVLQVPNGIETPKVNTPDGTPLEVPQGIETPTVSGQDGLPVLFPTGIRFDSPTPITITFDPKQSSISGITTSTTGPGTTSNPNDPASTIGSFGLSASGLSGPSGPSGPGGPCMAVRIELKDNEPLIGIDQKTGKRVKLLGSLASAASSAVSSAASSATSAASSAASVATSATRVVTTVLGTLTGCLPPSTSVLTGAGGVNLPSSGSGLPSTPSIGPDQFPSSLSGAVSGAAFTGSSPPPPSSTTATPPGTTQDAVVAAVNAAITGSPIPPGSTTTIDIWSGGLNVPIFNDSLPLPPCSSGMPDRGKFGVLKGNGTSDDAAIMCLDQPSKGGWGYYPFPTTERIVTDIFNANSTAGLKCKPGYCDITAYPNGTLFELDGTSVVLPGTCSFCNMQVDKYGRVIAFSSGNITAYNRSFSYDKTLTYYTDSGIIMDANSTFINAGPTVLNETLIEALNVTGPLQVGGAVSLYGPITVNGALPLQRSDCVLITIGTNSQDTITVPDVGNNVTCGLITIGFSGSYAATDTLFTVSILRTGAISTFQLGPPFTGRRGVIKTNLVSIGPLTVANQGDLAPKCLVPLGTAAFECFIYAPSATVTAISSMTFSFEYEEIDIVREISYVA